jgi:hypothetical protein
VVGNSGGSSESGPRGGGSSGGKTGGGGALRGGTVGATGTLSVGLPNTTASLPQPAFEGSNGGEVRLPRSLTPVTTGALRSPARLADLQPLQPVPGTPVSTVQACWTSIADGAQRYGAIRVDVASAGQLGLEPNGAFVAPIEVRIIYRNRGQIQARQSHVSCSISRSGQVVAIR